ncbi:MAG: FAD-dependent monooxygenase, partial [Cyanobacteria bacterium]|nr:FAD-dependent monooxygenase [Cyanobacteriota bacterium]
PPAAGGGFRIEKNALHIWPRGSFMVIALPNFDGSFTVTLFLPFEGEKSFEKLVDEASVQAFFEEEFPDLIPLVPDLVELFFDNPTGHMETIKCFPWNVGGKVLLVGDAAHGIVPFFGQGMNCGFEDLTVFDGMFTEFVKSGQLSSLPSAESSSETQSQWEYLLNSFVSSRKPNCDSIADMAVENFIEMRDKVADPRFLLQKSVEKRLSHEFPGKYLSRYQLVTFTNVPYTLAHDAGIVCDEILEELCRNVQSADEIDMDKAAALIERKLSPMLDGHPALASVAQ